MMKFDLAYLDEDESVKILNVLENDFQLRMKERERLGKLRKKIVQDDKLAVALADQHEFNNNCCIRCYKSFFLIFNPKFVCFACKFNVCKNCCEFFFQFRAFVCVTCQKEKDMMAQSCDWFYETVQRKFRQCGSVKVARRLSTIRQNQDPRRTRTRPNLLNLFTNAGAKDGSNSDNSDDEEEEQKKVEKAKQFEEAFPEVRGPRRFNNDKQATDFHVRAGTEEAENSQKGVLRRMKAMQMARFHERVREVMSQIRSDLRDNYPQGFPSVRRDSQLRHFVRKSREELTAILKNFAQILGITIESHNLALGRSSEDVQIDIQHILQDEVEGIVSHRVDVLPRRRSDNLDETTSMFTDDGSKVSGSGNVEQRLAAIILKKVIDDFRASLYQPMSPEEEAAIRELDQLIDEEDGRETIDRSSSGQGRSPRRQEADPDLLSLSETGMRRSQTGSQAVSRSGSQHSAGSGQWLLRSRASAAGIPAESLTGLGGRASARVGGRNIDDLSDLSGTSDPEDRVGFPSTTEEAPTLWTGTSNEETKNQILRQIRQQDSGVNVHYESPPSSAGLSSDTDSRWTGRSRTQRRIDALSRDMVSANRKTTGAASAVENTAEQMEGLFDQLSAIDRHVNTLKAELTPATALRKSSDIGVASASRALTHVRRGPIPFPVEGGPEVERKEVEEDIYIKAADMAEVLALIEELEGALLRDGQVHEAQKECPLHLQRWSSIEGHVVSTVERLDGDLRDVDNIGARVGSLTRREPRRSGAEVEFSPRRGSMQVRPSFSVWGESERRGGVRRSSSDVNFGASQRYDPWGRQRDAWDEYRDSGHP